MIRHETNGGHPYDDTDIATSEPDYIREDMS